ncbi:MAG: MerR family transcriptional regulator [Actinomycetota bacterium]
MKYRVDDLATRSGVSVDTIRFYQTRGLLEPPRREGRVAWYADDHLERLDRIRRLKANGFTLASIARLLAGDVEAADEALVDALGGPAPDDDADSLSLDELAARTGVSPALLRAVERERLLAPRVVDGKRRYAPGDVEVVTAGLALLESGLPLGELLALARRHDRAMREVAEHAVELFADFVRSPIRASSASEEEVAERMAEAFAKMLPATVSLVTSHFRRVLLEAAQHKVGRGESAGLQDSSVPGASGAK